MITYEQCLACAAVFYFERGFCPRCGSGVSLLESSGRGSVAARTLVVRPPRRDLPSPYAIVLVDMDEGFRVMGHADDDVRLGDVVQAGSADFDGTSIVTFGPP